MLKSQAFWVGVLVGIILFYLYQKYSAGKGKSS